MSLKDDTDFNRQNVEGILQNFFLFFLMESYIDAILAVRSNPLARRHSLQVFVSE